VQIQPASEPELAAVTASSTDDTRKLEVWASIVIGLALLSLWICRHPYSGIIHDARLYTVQALNALDGGRFSSDIYFKYGSQDAFTLFSLFYRPILALLGIPVGHLATAILGQALWCAGLIWLMRALFTDRRLLILALTAVIVLPSGYGPFGIFNYGEPFATPRIFAEALVLAGLGFAARGRLVSAIVFVAAAVAVHPIMAATGAGLLFIYIALRRPVVWLVGIGGGALVLGLAMVHAGPFARLLQSYDLQWFAIVKRTCTYAFLTNWRVEDVAPLLGNCAVLGAALYVVGERERRIILSLLILSTIGLGATFLGADIAKDVLIVNIQPWRVTWLVTMTASIGLVLLWDRMPKHFASREALILAAVLAGASGFWNVWITPGLMMSLGGFAAIAEFKRQKRLPMPAVVAMRTWMVMAVVAALFFAAVRYVLPDFLAYTARGLATVAALIALFRLSQWSKARLALLSLTCVAVSVATADARTKWEKFIEKPQVDPALLAFSLPGRNVYWENGLEVQWLKLQRPAYYSCLQRVGTMFYRSNAIDYDGRTAALRGLNTDDFGKDAGDICPLRADPKAEGPVIIGQLQAACRAANDLDAIILLHPVIGASSVDWTAPTHFWILVKGKAVKVTRFYRYDCAR
jgi:hypothetical protein